MQFAITRPRVAAAVTAVALAVPAAASAHVTLQPNTAAPGGFTRVDIRVPNEEDNTDTTKVRVQFPAGFESVSYEPRPGWTVEVTKSGDAVSEITFSGGRIAPGEFMDFGLSLRMPEGRPGDKLTFKALQTYDNGEVVRWIGPEDADRPAPTVTLTEAAGEAQHTPVPAAADSGDDGGDGLAIAALIVGALGLFAGGAALLATRRGVRVRA